ncbi:acyl-CoA N-acyltransferase [Xylariaceae sp. FL0255]|nr:acyl-CoA N-acyltransferase [Xylariaceae sp. FL0255]
MKTFRRRFSLQYIKERAASSSGCLSIPQSTSNTITMPASEELSAQQNTSRSKPSTEFTIGHATVADAEAIAQVGVETWTESYGWSISAADLAAFLEESYSVKRILADLEDPAKETFVARDSVTGRVLGFGQLIRNITESCIPGDPATHAELCRLFIGKDAQGKGVGSKIVAAIEAQAREEGFKQLWLSVWENAHRQQGLYERLGYVRVGTMKFPAGSHIHTDFVCTKSL